MAENNTSSTRKPQPASPRLKLPAAPKLRPLDLGNEGAAPRGARDSIWECGGAWKGDREVDAILADVTQLNDINSPIIDEFLK